MIKKEFYNIKSILVYIHTREREVGEKEEYFLWNK